MIRTLFIAAVVALLLHFGHAYLSSSYDVPTPAAIADLLRNPAAFDGKAVQLRGTVLGRASLFGVGAYRVGAPDGAALVVVGLRTAPSPGQSADVVGVFRMAFVFGDLQAPVVIAR